MTSQYYFSCLKNIVYCITAEFKSNFTTYPQWPVDSGELERNIQCLVTAFVIVCSQAFTHTSNADCQLPQDTGIECNANASGCH